ncbi:hypothetical protein [uncultured Mediterranea sp.]|uniref:hypothetical protein n=1 Tax=uncultured Mediterranea sp. TaxID=1926662 RepID=UPI00258420E6|nr:hypothetical protein [uncultured Mediterranea sp.]
MWWILFIGLIVFIGIKFIIDYNKQANYVAKQGGMKRKYGTLINYLLALHEENRILQEGTTHIRLGYISFGGSVIFNIVQTFGNVTIQWESNNQLFGKHKLEWNFNEFMNQEEMIHKILHDINVYSSNVVNKYK